MKQKPAKQFGPVLAMMPDDIAAERLRGLSDRAARLALQAGRQIDDDSLGDASATLVAALALAPNHPEMFRLQASLCTRLGYPDLAVATLQHVVTLRPDDVRAQNDFGDAWRASGNLEAAYAIWRRACERRPDSAAAWFNLGWNLDHDGRFDEAREALERTVALAPRLAAARLMLADVLVTLGEIERAAAEYRTTLQNEPMLGEAWCSLANIKTQRFSAAEVARMEQLDARTDLGEQAQAALEFALGKAYEDAARHVEALRTFHRANARMRSLRPWDPHGFSAHVDEVLRAFARPVAEADDANLGNCVIFIVGMPRSGSTLTEQILASHAQVEGAGELPDLMQVVREESARRGQMFPHWVATTTPADWARLGRRYLELTAASRAQRPVFVDKQPYNWLLAGAALAMLPAARIIDCRRDAMETCWSCYQQIFPDGPAFSYDIEHVAAFWKAHERAAQFWRRRFPGKFHELEYERLVADPNGQTRALLEFCGLPFDAACLEPHRTSRPVRTASAAQVREPLRSDTARAIRYGDLLAPLRRALGKP